MYVNGTIHYGIIVSAYGGDKPLAGKDYIGVAHKLDKNRKFSGEKVERFFIQKNRMPVNVQTDFTMPEKMLLGAFTLR
jgi:fructose-1,6-bisphosphatase/inositol monophosphatase family enzyme